MFNITLYARAPSINLCYRRKNSPTGESKSKIFKHTISFQLNNHISELPSFTPFSTDISISLVFHLSTKRSVDLDNLIKVTLDSFNNILFTDDKIITNINATRVLDSTVDKIDVNIISNT